MCIGNSDIRKEAEIGPLFFISIFISFIKSKYVLEADCRSLELQLWQITLRNAPVMVPPLMNLFPHLVSVMELNFEHLQVSWCTFVSFIHVYFIVSSQPLCDNRIYER